MTTLTIAEVLDKAADLIEPEGAWIQGAYAIGKSGREVKTFRAAICFCVIGAIDSANGASEIGVESNSEAIQLFAKVATGHQLGNVADWNDATGRTQSEVVAKLREAAALAREQQA